MAICMHSLPGLLAIYDVVAMTTGSPTPVGQRKYFTSGDKAAILFV